MPKVIGRICRQTSIPVIAGGLVSDKEDIMELLEAGVTSISSTNPNVWFL
jgi:glycerol-3-phosphate responsive antiterminator